MKNKWKMKELLILQAVVMIYTLATVIGKFAADSAANQNGMQFLFLYGAEIAVLGIYAVLWQQMLKKIELSVAYANRGMALLWSLLWAVLLFGEKITLQKVCGVAFVIAGILIVNGGRGEKDAV